LVVSVPPGEKIVGPTCVIWFSLWYPALPFTTTVGRQPESALGTFSSTDRKLARSCRSCGLVS
jgi:hypothetical protein